MPNFHPDISILNDYSAGSLSIGLSIAVKAHLEMCAECRHSIQNLEQAGAYFLESKTANLSSGLLDSLMSKIDTEKSFAPATNKNISLSLDNKANNGLPIILQKLLKGSIEELNWRNLGKKLRISKVISGDKKSQLAFYHIKAGGKVPHHKHKADEITLVLKGSFSDEDGIYRKGDFIVRTVGEQHSISATQNEDCLCLAVEEKPIAFTGWFRLLNPMMSVQPG